MLRAGAELPVLSHCPHTHTVLTLTASLSSQACAVTLPHLIAQGTQSNSLRNGVLVPTLFTSERTPAQTLSCSPMAPSH